MSAPIVPGHPFRVRRLLWLLAAVSAVAVALAADRGLRDLLERAEGGTAPGFSGVQCHSVEALLRFDPDTLTLSGSWTAILESEPVPGELTLELDPSCSVTSLTIGSRVYVERPAAWEQWLAWKSDLRRFVVLDDDEPAGDAEQRRISILYRAPATALSSTTFHPPLPLVLGARRYLPRVHAEPLDTEFVVAVPAEPTVAAGNDWRVFAVDGVPATEESGATERRYHLTARQGVLPVFAAGPLVLEEFEAGGHAFRLFTAGDRPVPMSFFETAAAEMNRRLPGWLPPELSLLLTANAPGRRPVRLGATQWMARPPAREYELVHALASAAISPVGSKLPESLRCAPELVALLSVPGDDAETYRTARSRMQAAAGRSESLDAWMALAAMRGAGSVSAMVSGWFARHHAEGATSGTVLEDAEDARFYEWAVRKDVDLRFEGVERRAKEQLYTLSVNVVVTPRARVVLPPVEIAVVYEGRVERYRLDLRDGRGTLRRDVPLPLRVLLDPEERFPDRQRANNVFVFTESPEPEVFAVTRNSTVVAFTPAFQRQEWPYGIYLFDLSAGEAPRFRTWFECLDRVRSMSWVGEDHSLFLEVELPSGQIVKRLLDLRDGRTCAFPADAMPAPGGEYVLANERHPDRYRHTLYHLPTRREIPFQNQVETPVSWVEGADLLLESSAQQTTVYRPSGEVAGNLPHGNAALRLVRATPLGLAFITETAQGSRLHHLARDGKAIGVYEAPGIILDYVFTEDSAGYYVFVEMGKDDYAVFRTRQHADPRLVYRGSQRPLADVHSLKGVLLLEGATATIDRDRAYRLMFYSFDRDHGDIPAVLCDEISLQCQPVLASAGRYLYYLALDRNGAGLPAKYRQQSLHRHDFLTERSEPLFSVQQ